MPSVVRGVSCKILFALSAKKKEHGQRKEGMGGRHAATTHVLLRRALSRPSFAVRPLPRRLIAGFGFWQATERSSAGASLQSWTTELAIAQPEGALCGITHQRGDT